MIVRGTLAANLYEGRNMKTETSFRFMMTMSNLLPFLISPPFLSLNCPVCFRCGFSTSFSSYRALNFSRESFHSYVSYSDLLQWKVNPIESFCQLFFPEFLSHLWLFEEAVCKAKPPLLWLQYYPPSYSGICC